MSILHTILHYYQDFTLFSSRSLYRSPKRPKCGLINIVYFTNSSIQSTNRSRFPLGKIL